MKENIEFMGMARQSLSGKWGKGVSITALYFVIAIAVSLIEETNPQYGIWLNLLSILFFAPLAVGLAYCFLGIAQGKRIFISDLFSGFNQYGRALCTYLLTLIFTILWTLLLIIPGLIKSYAYSMTFFIINDDPQIGANEAIERSMQMMDGYKWKLFCLHLRFLGWIILGVLSLGFGLLWVYPYILTAMAHFYEDRKAEMQEIVEE